VGPSGSGKSTALRVVAGLEDATTGTVSIGGRVMNDVAPKDRDIAMVFQSYALYPHMPVKENLGFALRLRGERAEAIGSRVAHAADRLSISPLLGKRPAQLSGGQRQRVALGRAIVREPQAFLMDEPLSNLDAKLRVEMRAYIARLHRELGTTVLYVTHDQTEAMTMGDRVAVMRDGRLEQVATPQELYDHPANVFVAGFMGSPAMNLMRGRVSEDPDGLALELGSQRIALPSSVGWAHPELARYAGSEVVVGVRPEALTLARREAGVAATVDLVEALGSDLLLHAELDAPAVPAAAVNGSGTLVVAPPEHTRVTARVSPAVRPAPGEQVRLALDAERLHFFDPGTERAIG
jgi:multiple sugar transport system ATP-binding protein